MTGIDVRKDMRRNSKGLTHFLIPGPGMHVKTVESIPLGDILGHMAGQLKSDVAVGLENLIYVFKHLWHMFFIPEYLSCGVRRL